ncbi:MAG: ribulose-phosphate 3-epimerase [Mycoplasmatales bacterium]
MEKILVAPSILASDFLNLEQEIIRLNNSDCDMLHLDVMDGIFVPNITFGYDLVSKINKVSTKPLDCHLMIIDPIKYIEHFAKAGADIITFHYESNSDVLETICQIKKHNVKIGLSIKPDTDIKEIEHYLELLDLVLIMSVEPGFGGQSYIDSASDKLSRLRQLKEENNYHYIIQVDGGINQDTYQEAISSGAECLVAGSYLFNDEMDQRIKVLKNV